MRRRLSLLPLSNQPPKPSTSNTYKLLLTNSYIFGILHVSANSFESLDSTRTCNSRCFCNFHTLVFQPPPTRTKPTTCALFEKHRGYTPFLFFPFPNSQSSTKSHADSNRKAASAANRPGRRMVAAWSITVSKPLRMPSRLGGSQHIARSRLLDQSMRDRVHGNH